MQQLILHKKLYSISRIDETNYSEKVYSRLTKINSFKKLRGEGCSIGTSCEVLKVPQATLYRWRKNYKKFGLSGLEDESKRPIHVRKNRWDPRIVQTVLTLRRSNPLYGKYKIAILLKRDYGASLSVSTTGRIIAYLIKRNEVQPASFYQRKRCIRPRIFNNYAQRWKVGMKAKNPGELFQIDHMSISLVAGHCVKHFQGICPVTKLVVEEAYSQATSNIAKQFLMYAQASLPFKLKSVQVDGGSEFMRDFEQACKELNIALYVLPPRSPEYNGNVERANASAKFEFYAFYTGPLKLFNLRKALQQYVKKYNSYRPHQALQYLTPLQYYSRISGA